MSSSLRTVLDYMSQGISVFDAANRLTVWNPQYAEMFEMDPGDLRVGVNFLDLLNLQMSKGNFEGNPEEFQRRIAQAVAFGADLEAVACMRSGRAVRSIHSPLPGGGWVGMHEDVSAAREQARQLSETGKHLRSALASMRQGLSIYDGHGQLTLWNDKYRAIYNLPLGALRVGMSFTDVLEARRIVGTFSGDADKVAEKQFTAFARLGEYNGVSVLRNGAVIEVQSVPIPEGGWISTHEDVTAEHDREAELSTQNMRFEAAINNMRHGLCLFDRDQQLVVCNPAFADIFRLPKALTVKGTSLQAILEQRESVGSLPIQGNVAPDLTGLVAGGVPAESIVELQDGRVVRALHRIMSDGGWVATFEDITEQRRIEARSRRESLHDALTGLPNRRYLEKVISEAEAHLEVPCGEIALLHLDLDHFKQINDTLGHQAGDAMLIHVAEVLAANVGDSDFVGRVGGDEFVVVCGKARGTDDLAKLADRLISEIRTPVRHHGHVCRLSASIGIAHNAGRKFDGKALLVNADLALFQAKRAGRGCYRLFTASMQSDARRTKRIADEILWGIERGEFGALYQPQINAHTLQIAGVEALVRWRHPRRGLLTPDKFLKVAEDMGIVGVIDEIVFNRALRDFSMWQEQGLSVPRVSVNVSARRLSDEGLIKLLRKSTIQPGTVAFELLESMYLDESDDIVSRNISQLREIGIDLEVDDFGTGHTSILSLLKLKPKALKIDRRIVAPIVQDEAQRNLIRSIVEIGHSLGIRVTAEGIETVEHAEIAAGLGCDELQGYAFSRPITADALREFSVSANLRLPSYRHFVETDRR